MAKNATRRPGARKAKPAPTYESEVLGVLVYEFSFSDKEESEHKIKGRLKRKKLGTYDPDRVNHLRELKDDLQAEIHKQKESAYYVRSTTSYKKEVEIEDFDIPRLIKDMVAKYPNIPKSEVEGFVRFAVFVYHLL